GGRKGGGGGGGGVHVGGHQRGVRRRLGHELVQQLQASPSVETRKLTPVTLPPGRLRLATRPSRTGSVPVTNTIGTFVVAALAASAGRRLPTITLTGRRTRSAIRADSRSARLSA